MTPLATLALLLCAGPLAPEAHADPRGIVARVVVGPGASGSPSMVRLVPTGDNSGDTVEIPLNDAGTDSDVEAGDGIFSGTLWVEGETFDVTLVIDGEDRAAGAVEWDVDDQQRDLNVTLTGSEISVSAEVKQPLPPQPDGSEPGDGQDYPPVGEGGELPPPGDGGPGALPPGSAPPTNAGGSPGPGGGPMALGTGEQPDGSAPQSSGLLQILGLVLGLLAIVAVVWWWRQPLEDDEEDGTFDLPEDLSLMPEGGFLGEGTPSLSDGVVVFGVSRTDAPRLVGPFLATLARTRVVVLAAPGTLDVPGVVGLPVYKAGDQATLKDALGRFARSRSSRAVGLVVAEAFDATAKTELARGLPAGVGVAVLAIEPPAGLPGVISVRRDGGDAGVRYGQCWVFSSVSAKEGELIDAIEGPEGLSRVVEG